MLANWIYVTFGVFVIFVNVHCWKSSGNRVNIGRRTTYVPYASQSMMAQWYCEICKLHEWNDCLQRYCNYYSVNDYSMNRATVYPTYTSLATMEQWYCEVCSLHGLYEGVQHYCRYRYSGTGGSGHKGYYSYGKHFNKFNKHVQNAYNMYRPTVYPSHGDLHMLALRYCEICRQHDWTECVPRHCYYGYSGNGGGGYGNYYGYGQHLKKISKHVKKA